LVSEYLGHGCHGNGMGLLEHQLKYLQPQVIPERGSCLPCFAGYIEAGSLPPTLWLEHCLELRETSFVFGDGEKPQGCGGKIHHE